MQRARRVTRECACAGLALLLAVSVAAAQDEEAARGIKRDPTLGPQDLTQPQEADSAVPQIRLPEMASGNSNQLSANVERVECRELRLEGSTVLSSVDVRSITTAYIGREVSAEELEAVRVALTRLYIDRGYIASGVTLPDQDISSGVVVLHAVEGRLVRIDVRGQPVHLGMDSLLRGVNSLRTRPLRLADLQEQLTLIDQRADIGAERAELHPGETPGAAVLVLEFDAAHRLAGTLTIDNHRAPSVGAEQATLRLIDRSLLGVSDRLDVYYAATQGLDDAGLSYDIPLSGSGWRAQFDLSHNDAGVLEEPFDRIDIRSNAQRRSFGFRYDTLPALAGSASFGAMIEDKRSETSLLGLPFSFAPGVVDGRAEVAVLRLDGQWLRRSSTDALFMRLGLGYGLGLFGATQNENLPDSRFLTVQGEAQYVRDVRPDAGGRLILHGDVQVANRSLLPLEKFSLGGAGTVRGYRHNQVVRDNGYLVSAEYQQPLPFAAARRLGLNGAAFVDVGRGWNSGGYGPAPQSVESIGLGLLWKPVNGWHAELYAAIPFRDFNAAQHNLQDSGVHFLIGYDWH